ncbi:MAG: glycoside hydrolase family 31 protein [Acidobacteriota bacterium]|nr:glycoside hydrolase family 31 protein [Acidobacteriota bacterium]
MNRLARSTLFICALLLSAQLFGQIAPGSVMGAGQESYGVVFRMTHGAMKIEVLTPRVMRVIYSPDGLFENHPDPMIAQTSWPPAQFSMQSSAKDYTLSTGELRAVVAKSDGHITFEDAAGKTLLREGGDNGGKLMTPAVVNGEKTYHASEYFFPSQGEAFYGLGQHQAGVWDYSGESVELSQDNTNISIPFFVSSLGYGVFWNNPSVTRFNDRFAQHLFLYAAVADDIDYYFMYGPKLDDVIADYRSLTGEAPLLPKWAYGFWQCKNRYNSEAEILAAAAKYRQLGIPVDNIVQDWFWWTKMGSFVFNKNYPDPKAMVDTLHREHFHVMISVWPSFVPGTQPFETFERNGWFIHKNSASASWLPGAGLYDAFNPKARKYYWSLIDSNLFRLGFDAWWLDTDEPESFEEQNIMLHAHTAMGSGARYADLYPLMHTMGVYQGQRSAEPDKRVFILSRSAAAGMQRNSAVAWSGDVFSTWAAFKRQVPAGLNYSISGLPYWTTDIGGFIWGDPAKPAFRKLVVRWFEYGAFCPVFRLHGTRAGNLNELWTYGPQAQSIMVKYDKLRYRLLPYIYSLAWRVTNQGYTLMRPLVMNYPADERARETGSQFMFGPALMVSPVTDPDVQTRRIYLPQGNWFDFWTGLKVEGGQFITASAPLETIPVYVPAGSIIPMGPVMQYTGQKPEDPIEIRVYPGASGDFTLYDDDGATYDYQKGAYATIPIHWDDAAQKLTIGNRKGSYPAMLRKRTFRVVWVSEGHGNGLAAAHPADQIVQYTGRAVSITRQ